MSAYSRESSPIGELELSDPRRNVVDHQESILPLGTDWTETMHCRDQTIERSRVCVHGAHSQEHCGVTVRRRRLLTPTKEPAAIDLDVRSRPWVSHITHVAVMKLAVLMQVPDGDFPPSGVAPPRACVVGFRDPKDNSFSWTFGHDPTEPASHAKSPHQQAAAGIEHPTKLLKRAAPFPVT